jgi:hypothetical protein
VVLLASTTTATAASGDVFHVGYDEDQAGTLYTASGYLALSPEEFIVVAGVHNSYWPFQRSSTFPLADAPTTTKHWWI